MKNVLFITHCLSLHGANRSLLGLIDGLKNKVNCIVICPDNGPIAIELQKRNIEYYVLPINYWMWKEKKGRIIRLINNILSSIRCYRIIHKEKIDLIYSNSSATPLGAFISFLYKKPHIWHIREFGDIDYNLQHDWGNSFFRYWIKRAKHIICISNSIKEHVVPYIKDNVSIIYNGIIFKDQLEKNIKNIKPFKEKKDYTFINIGQVNPNKNQEDAILAFSSIANKYPDIRLLIVGDHKNEYGNKIIKICEDLNIKDKVTFYNFINNPLEILSNTDAFIMCSKNEGLGRVTLEAMSYGKPIIGFDNAGTKEIIEDGKDGVFYNNHEKLSKLMEKFIQEQEWAYKLGLNGIRKIERSFLIEYYAENIYKIIKEL